jgi:hypothetical protein
LRKRKEQRLELLNLLLKQVLWRRHDEWKKN